MFKDIYKAVDPIHRHLNLEKYLRELNRNPSHQRTIVNDYDEPNEDPFPEMQINVITVDNENSHNTFSNSYFPSKSKSEEIYRIRK